LRLVLASSSNMNTGWPVSTDCRAVLPGFSTGCGMAYQHDHRHCSNQIVLNYGSGRRCPPDCLIKTPSFEQLQPTEGSARSPPNGSTRFWLSHGSSDFQDSANPRPKV
jgi:hypothetical protein